MAKISKDWVINKLSDGLGETQRLIDDLADTTGMSELARVNAHISGVFAEIEDAPEGNNVG